MAPRSTGSPSTALTRTSQGEREISATAAATRPASASPPAWPTSPASTTLKFAAGQNVAVHAHTEPAARRAYRLETTWLPTYDVPATIAQVEEGTPLAGAELSMDVLAQADPDALRIGLLPCSPSRS